MDADQLLAHRLDQQGGHHRAVHPAGQGQQDLFIPDLAAQRVQLLGDKGLGQGGRGDALHGFGTLVVGHRHK